MDGDFLKGCCTLCFGLTFQTPSQQRGSLSLCTLYTEVVIKKKKAVLMIAFFFFCFSFVHSRWCCSLSSYSFLSTYLNTAIQEAWLVSGSVSVMKMFAWLQQRQGIVGKVFLTSFDSSVLRDTISSTNYCFFFSIFWIILSIQSSSLILVLRSCCFCFMNTSSSLIWSLTSKNRLNQRVSGWKHVKREERCDLICKIRRCFSVDSEAFLLTVWQRFMVWTKIFSEKKVRALITINYVR